MSGPLSPLPGHDLEAYLSSLVVHPGDSLDLMVSGTGPATVEMRRLIHGDPNPVGPGYRDEPVPWQPPTEITLEQQTIDFGSYIRVPDVEGVVGDGDITFGTWVLPTLLHSGWNTIAAQWGVGEVSFGLFAAEKTLVGGVSVDGNTVEWLNAKEFVYLGVWQFVALSYNHVTGVARIYQHFRSDHPRATPQELVVSEQKLSGGRLHRSKADIYMGALPPVHSGQVGHWAHFNGKLGSPVLAAAELTADQISEVCSTGRLEAPLLARWDLSREVATRKVVDVSGNGRDGVAVNLPARAVTGVGYQRHARYVREGSYSRSPEDYDAIFFHEDDLDDAGWEPVASVTVPGDARPGIYAAVVSTDRDRVYAPLVVSEEQPAEELVVLLPTLTWTAYTANRSPYSFTRDGVLDRGNSLYTPHTDGSPVWYVTRRRPTRAHDPTAGFEQRGAHKITANLYLVDWLETQGYGYGVTTDDDLHHRGVEALGACRCLLVGSHPEYWTPQMLVAFERYLERGGRVVYMGAEFLLWVATIDPERPYLMEVRKSAGGDYHPSLARPPGEAEHSTAPVLGGGWAERGRNARNLVGVEVSAQAWHHLPPSQANGFTRTEHAREERFRWVFAGLDEDPIGTYGLNFGSAAWMEMDATLPGEPMPGVERWVLATSRHADFWSSLAETPTADLVLSTWPNGAAVFAAGSLTWTGSLSHNGYDNGVSAITRNVIDRFLARPDGDSVLD